MTPLFSETEFSLAKSTDLLPIKCKKCEITFFRQKRLIQSVLAKSVKNTCNYCSQACANSLKTKKQKFICSSCGKSIEKTASQYGKSKSGNSFCSRSCSVRYNNTHKKFGFRISKMERYLQQQLTKLYPDLEFHFNRKDAINSELDIYIPSLKLAFELNGIFHYEPIYGKEKLNSIQNNDDRKFQACHERKIELCIIDISNVIHFKENKAVKFLSIIQQVIEQKITTSQK